METNGKTKLPMALLGIALSLGAIYVTFYVAGKAWKKS
jgi:hypothetical protein